MKIIIYIILVVILMYCLDFYRVVREPFQNNVANNNNNNNNNKNKNNTSEISQELGNSLLRQLRLLDANKQKTTNIAHNSFNEPNQFIPYVEHNFRKINQIQEDNINRTNKEYRDKLKSLQKQINSYRSKIDLDTNLDVRTIKSISSNQNGQALTVVPIANDKHLVVVNNKCMASNNVGYYQLDTCNYSDPYQHFQLTPVYHDIDYNLQIAPGKKKVEGELDSQNRIIKYPFYTIKSVTSGNCLQNKDSIVTIQGCEANSSQRWSGSEVLHKCKK